MSISYNLKVTVKSAITNQMDQEGKVRNIPTVFIIFGATGDLMAKKILPALFHLYTKGKLPKLFQIIGFSRRDWTSDQFKRYLEELLEKHEDRKKFRAEDIASFLEYFIYQKGDFEKLSSYKMLAEYLGRTDGAWRVCSNKLFYLAVPPQHYKTIFEHLASSGLTIPCSPEEGFTRVVVEKPFGNDFDTAQKLDSLMGRLFKEDQLFRIDHYLAKEMLQNILSFRFDNNLFESSWNKGGIEKIEIKLLESIGIEGRGAYYDATGALRDVGQNHLLQMAALVTMDQPESYGAKSVRKRRFEILSKLVIPREEEIKRDTFRAQYKGYKNEEGVLKNSHTETYFKVVAYLDSPRWQGVPIILEAGKRLPRRKEIVITFRHKEPCLCPPNIHYQNKIIFSLEPKEEIRVEFWAKKPGLEFEMEKQTLTFLYRDQRKKVQYIEEYEKLLLDCIMGNQLLFLNTEEVLATWRFIDPIIAVWQENKVPLRIYEPDKKKILEESAKIEQFEKPAALKRKEMGLMGLGKMGGNIARRLHKKGWRVVAYNRTSTDTDQFVAEGGQGAYSLSELVQKLERPRIILLSLPAGDATRGMIKRLLPLLSRGDYLIDGANGYYKDAVANAADAEKKSIHFIDVGISGGPSGALNGASLMIGGNKKDFEYLIPLFDAIAVKSGVQFFPGYGAGHFVKMVHNGIEYGMMQAIAEGFTVLKKSPFKLDLTRVADIYNHGSVIESRLVDWLKQGFEKFGEELKDVSGTVSHTGEGEWTVETACELNIETPVISDSLKFRIDSAKKPSYTGKILSTLRNMFGGHSAKEK